MTLIYVFGRMIYGVRACLGYHIDLVNNYKFSFQQTDIFPEDQCPLMITLLYPG